jgi:hypothetical protein
MLILGRVRLQLLLLGGEVEVEVLLLLLWDLLDSREEIICYLWLLLLGLVLQF